MERLSLDSNQLSSVEWLSGLTNLQWLYLSSNQIADLPEWICDFTNMDIIYEKKNTLGSINFYDNPLKSPPVEVVKQGKDAIKRYF